MHRVRRRDQLLLIRVQHRFPLYVDIASFPMVSTGVLLVAASDVMIRMRIGYLIRQMRGRACMPQHSL